MIIETFEGHMVNNFYLRKYYIIRGANDKYNVFAEFKNGDTIVLQVYKTRPEAEKHLVEIKDGQE